jgi:hypothetical protein
VPIDGAVLAQRIGSVIELTPAALAVTAANHAEARAALVLLALQVYPLLRRHFEHLRIAAIYEADPLHSTMPEAVGVQPTGEPNTFVFRIPLRSAAVLNQVLDERAVRRKFYRALGLATGVAHDALEAFIVGMDGDFVEQYGARVPRDRIHLIKMGVMSKDWQADYEAWWAARGDTDSPPRAGPAGGAGAGGGPRGGAGGASSAASMPTASSSLAAASASAPLGGGSVGYVLGSAGSPGGKASQATWPPRYAATPARPWWPLRPGCMSFSQMLKVDAARQEAAQEVAQFKQQAARDIRAAAAVARASAAAGGAPGGGSASL